MEGFLSLPLTYQLVLGYLVIINIGTFLAYGIDKLFAIHKSRRISEKTLLVLALLGGSLGALAAMEWFRHKTSKMSFQALFVLIFILQIAAAILLTSL